MGARASRGLRGTRRHERDRTIRQRPRVRRGAADDPDTAGCWSSNGRAALGRRCGRRGRAHLRRAVRRWFTLADRAAPSHADRDRRRSRHPLNRRARMTDELIAEGSRLEQLATGGTWNEGPLWIPDERAVRWSDIPGNRIMRWDAATGEVSVHRSEVEFTNGRMLDRDGSVVQCSHGRRRLERESADGELTELVAHWGEHRLNSPNDVALVPDGSYWFTDPDYGIRQPQEGHPGVREYGDCRVFRWSDSDGLTSVIDDSDRPNGIAFAPDGKTVYVSDTAAALGDGPGHWIRAYEVQGATASG